MKNIVLICSVISLIFAGCCEFDESDVQFTKSEGELIKFYSAGYIMTFVNSNDSIQKWQVLDIDTTLKTGCFMQGTFQDISIKLSYNKDSLLFDNSFTLSKWPNGINGITDLNIDFEGSSGYIKTEDNFKSTPFKTIELRGLNINDLIEIQARYMERKIQPSDITHLYWSKKGGLAAYKSVNGEVWIEKRWL